MKEKLEVTGLTDLWREEDGQDTVEYALLMAFIALAVVSLLNAVGGSISNMWTSISSTVNSATKASS